MAHQEKKPFNPAAPVVNCRIFEILLHNCQLTPEGGYHCYPIPRIFRICDGRPAVEITKLVDVDPTTGEVTIPEDPAKMLPKARPWRDVFRYELPPGSEYSE